MKRFVTRLAAILLLLVAPLTAQAFDLTSLVSYWKLSDVNDSVGGNTLTNGNTVTFTSGKIGNAATFVAASSQRLSHADNAALRTGDIDFTITAWAKFASQPANPIVVGKDDNTSRDYTLDYDQPTNRFRFYINGGTKLVASSKTDLTTGVWYFVVAWHDAAGDTLNIQVNNGTVDSAATAGTAPNAGGAQFDIGCRNFTGFEGYWDGQIDEVGLWKRKLTANERTQLYNGTSGLGWPFMFASRSRSVNLGISKGAGTRGVFQ